MTAPTASRTTLTFPDRADALGHFFQRAGEAPRLIAYDDELGCPLHSALAAFEWTRAVGVLEDTDLLHAGRLGGETAAAVIERRRDGRRTFIYFGPRMDAPPADPYEGTLLFDEPGVRAYEFAQRVHAVAHFLRATQGVGGVIAMLTKRAPELRHVSRALAAMFADPVPQVSNHMLAGWFATGGGGILFLPTVAGDPYVYQEVGSDS
ncbi:MAG: hypothetical protein EXR93_04590 [Gemmatimonadetes bacterium]|nr:hypothetical protein [Gemmatimonadota bacterium]